ncbi:MAG: hypothetical protein WBA46_05805 [Thermomicrobiales bacterium]
MTTKTARKKPEPRTDLFVVNRRSRWVEWVDANEPDAVPFRARIRSNLTFGEIEALTFEPGALVKDLHVQLAPFVYEWNAAIEEDGEVVELPAPADTDEDVFSRVPNAWFWWLWNSVKNEGTERLDPKGSDVSRGSHDNTDDTSED